jgi:hypothetical protein
MKKLTLLFLLLISLISCNKDESISGIEDLGKWDFSLIATNVNTNSDQTIFTIEVDLNKSRLTNPWRETKTFTDDVVFTMNLDFSFDQATNRLSCDTLLFENLDPTDAYRNDTFSVELLNDELSFNLILKKIGQELNPISLRGKLQKK